MGKYKEEAGQLLQYVGGRENIAAVTHCVTRMRFVLKEPKKADVAAIESLPSTKGTFTQAGQFQVIIGSDVANYYKDFTGAAGIEGVSKDEAKAAAKKNQSPLQRVMSNLAEIFAPLIPVLIVGGLILGFRSLIGDIPMLDGGTKTLTDTSQFWAGVYSFLWLIGEAIFHMLPVPIVWSVTKKMGGTQALGIVLGLTLVSPQLLNAYSVAGTAAADIPVWDFGFFQMNMIGYQAQVIPAILAGFTLVYIERFFKKISPQVVSMIVVPFCSLVVSVIVAHAVLGPIGWAIGSKISEIVNAGLASSFNWAFAAVFGFFYAPLVITGLHHMSNAIDLQLIADFGSTNLWPMIALSNIAQGSAVLAMIFLQKKDTKAKEVSVPACISCYLGVTEPAIFGVNLKYMFPFICGMIGSSIAAVISITTGVRAFGIGVGGLPGILSIVPEMAGRFAVAMAVAIAVPFALTFAVGKKRGIGNTEGEKVEEKEAESQQSKDQAWQGEVQKEEGTAAEKGTGSGGELTLRAFLSGKSVPIEEVPDQVFSTKALGDGMAIDPVDECLVAPADGEVTLVMEGSFHACAMKFVNGCEVLFHIGLDTVDMNGDGFRSCVKAGDLVKTGDRLIEFEKEKIKAAGHPAITMMVITDMGAASSVKFMTGEQQAGQTTAAVLK